MDTITDTTLTLQDAVWYVEAHGFGVSEEIDKMVLDGAREYAEHQDEVARGNRWG